MRFRRRPHDITYDDLVNERVAPQGRVRPLHRLVSFVRRHAKCLRRKVTLSRDELSFIDLLAAIEQSYVLLVLSSVPRHDAEEVVQRSLEKLYERQDQIPPEKRPAWLRSAVRITNQERLQEWARKQRLAPAVAHDLAEQVARTCRPADVQLGTAQLDADAQRLFRLLRPEEQAVVDLHVFQDMTIDDVAAALGIPQATARKRWRLAVDRLLLHIEREDTHEVFQSGGFKRYVLAAAVLLWLRVRHWFRRSAGAMHDATAGTTHAARWPIIAIAVPLLALPILVLLRRAPSAPEVSSVDEAMASNEEIVSSVGLFLSTWAERERDSGGAVAMMISPPHARSAPPENTATDTQDVSKARPPREARALLGTAQSALDRNALSIFTSALRRYESMYPDDPYPHIHAKLRDAFKQKSVPH